METFQKQQQIQTQELHQIQVQVQEMDVKLDQILTILTGNELDKETGGMIKKVKDHGSRIHSIEKLRDRVMYFLIGLSFFAGWGAVDMVKKLLTKTN